MAQFLEKLLAASGGNEPEIIHYAGAKFHVIGLDIFQLQRIERAALMAANAEMDSTAPHEWKEQPGTTPGMNRWDEERDVLMNIYAGIERIVESLQQEDGTPIYTNSAEKDAFRGWVRKNVGFWQVANVAIAKKITALSGNLAAQPGLKAKKRPSKQK